VVSGFTHESTAVNTPVEWYTPKYIFDALGQRFDLDPASPGKGLDHVPAAKVFTKADDGLIQPWPPDAFVWLNPPYGKLTAPFLAKLANHPGGGIALAFARTDTKWFHETVQAPNLTGLCFVAGRIQFHRGDAFSPPVGGATCGSLLLAFGFRAWWAIKESGLGFAISV